MVRALAGTPDYKRSQRARYKIEVLFAELDIRWFGQGAIVVATCDLCKGIFEIERPSIMSHIKQCGKRERLPERERLCETRDHGKPRISHAVRWI